MLNSLTPKQEKLMHQVKQEWLDRFFLKKEKVNKEIAIKGIEWIYSLAQLKKPIIVFVSSPYAAQVAVNYAKLLINNYTTAVGGSAQVGAQVGAQVRAQVGDQVWDQVGAQVWDQVGAQVRAQVGAQVGAQVRAQVRAQVGAQVRDQVRAQVRDQVRAQVGDQVWAQVRAQVGAQVRAQVGAQVWAQVRDQEKSKLSYESFSNIGCADYNWVGFYDFFQRLNLVKNDNYDSFMQFLKSNVYDMIQLDGLCIVCELPSEVKRNIENRLHSTDSYAVQWSDGYVLHFINGRSMPSHLFDKSFTKNDFIKEKNEDIKAGMYEIIEASGEGSMLKFLNAKEIDKQNFIHANGEIEEMILYKTVEKFAEEEDLNGQSPAQLAWLKMSCASTGQNYLIPSDSSFDNCIDAAKYHRPSEVPNKVDYKWNSRS